MKLQHIKFTKEALSLFYNTVPRINDSETAKMFLKDILSSKEIKNIARRLLSVKKLREGNTFQEINQESGMGMATINKMHFKTKGSKVLGDLLK